MHVALSGMRRSMIFPYLRVWALAKLIVKDVSDILAAGKRCILRCLLQVMENYRESRSYREVKYDPLSFLNRPFCVL